MTEKSVQNEAVAELVKHLPMKLRVGLRVEVLNAAVEEGYLTVTAEGKLAWLLESKTLLAYFCGRMWCGDSYCYSQKVRAYLWVCKEVPFPKKDLENLFCVCNLRSLRKNRHLHPLPAGWELIDKIFEKK